MAHISILTDMLRKDLKDEYEILRDVFYLDNKPEEDIDYLDDEDNFDDDEIDDIFSLMEEEIEEYLSEEEIDSMIDDLFDEETDKFVKQVYKKLSKYIKDSGYRNIIYLILLNDAFEYIKSKLINGIALHDFEYEFIEKLEDHSTEELIKKLNNSDAFLLDMLTLFFEYSESVNEIDRSNNRKMIKMTKDRENFKKFKVYFLDDLHYEYIKRRNK